VETKPLSVRVVDDNEKKAPKLEQKSESQSSTPIDLPPFKIRKRHTRILGTLAKKSSCEFIEELIRYKIDGFRILADFGQEVCSKQIKFIRQAAEKYATKVVILSGLR
jgi:hypothetical protein